MASTFHGGIDFSLPICASRQAARLIGASIKLVYRADDCSLKVGDAVKGGSILGSLNAQPVRSSLSGKVIAIDADEAGVRVTVESDGQNSREKTQSFGKKTGKTLAEATVDELLAEIASSGIIEQSGLPLIDHLRRALAYAPGKLRMAAVCCFDLDPLCQTNVSVTEQKAVAVAGGLTILLKLLKLRDGAMLCDSRFKQCVKAVRSACADSSLIAIETTPNRYPQADPRLLTRWLTDMELSPAKVPEDAGLFLTDAETCASLYRLFATGAPERFKRVSIYAEGALRVCDLPFGLKLSDIWGAVVQPLSEQSETHYRLTLDYLPEAAEPESGEIERSLNQYDLACGLNLSEQVSAILLPKPQVGETICRGGMDGAPLPERVDATLNAIACLPKHTLDLSAQKADADEREAATQPAAQTPTEENPKPKRSVVTSLLSALSANGNVCISCGRCAAVCPMFLLPYDYLPKSRLQKLLGGSPIDGASCIGCGCCSYICPAGLPLRTAVRAAARKEAHNGK